MIIYKYYKLPSKSYFPEYLPDSVHVYHVGIIKSSPAVYSNLGEELEKAKYLPGWHVNICYDKKDEQKVDLSSIEQYEIFVKTPKCKWFGQSI